MFFLNGNENVHSCTYMTEVPNACTGRIKNRCNVPQKDSM
jgi:hypothetical protein